MSSIFLRQATPPRRRSFNEGRGDRHTDEPKARFHNVSPPKLCDLCQERQIPASHAMWLTWVAAERDHLGLRQAASTVEDALEFTAIGGYAALATDEAIRALTVK